MDDHVPFLVPVNPGNTIDVADGPTAAVLRVRTENHRNSLRNFHMYRNTDLALKQQLLIACPATFFETLRHSDFGFARVSTLQLLTHLHNTYGKVSPTDIMKKQNELNTPFWNPPLPLESLFSDILKKRDYLLFSNGTLVDPSSLVNAAYLNFEATGLYTADCKLWRQKPTADKTWAHLCEFFTEAESDRTRVTASDMNYHSANAIAPVLAPIITPMGTTAITDPTMTALLANMTTVTKLLQQQTRRRGARNRSNTFAGGTKQTQANGTHLQSNQQTGSKSWCHTHGYMNNRSHNSMTCRNKGPNHVDGATAPNPNHPNYVYSEIDSRFTNAAIE
jgi:hypothetical protein